MIPSLDNVLNEMRSIERRLATGPPPIQGIVMHHSVPYGRVFKQWDAAGFLWVWVNKGEVIDMPRRIEAQPDVRDLVAGRASIARGGTPVYDGHLPYWAAPRARGR